MEVRLTARRPENLFVTLVLPAVLLLFFGAVPVLPDAATATPGARPIDGVLPAMLATAIVAAGLVNLGISTGFERSYGVLKRLGAFAAHAGASCWPARSPPSPSWKASRRVTRRAGVVAFGWAPGAGWSPAAVVAAVRPRHGHLQLDGAPLRRHAPGGGDDGRHQRPLPARPAPGRPAGAPATSCPDDCSGALASLLPTAALADALRVGWAPAAADPHRPLALLAAWAAGTSFLTARTFRWE